MGEFPLPEGYLQYRKERGWDGSKPEPEKPRSRKRGVDARKAAPDRIWDSDPELAVEAEAERKAAEAAGDRGAAPGATEPPVPPECPIVPLGHSRGVYFFISPSGQFADFSSGKLSTAGGQLELFDGDIAWLRAFYPPGRPSEGDYNIRRAAAGLITLCAAKGLWSVENPSRHYGVWRATDELLIAHAGGVLHYSDGTTRRAGMVDHRTIYPALPDHEPPAAEPASAGAVRSLRDAYRLWRFEPMGIGADRGPSGLAADLLFCATSLALLGAAPHWRVHVLVKAVAGSGKSLLMSLIAAALGAQGVAMNNFTEAGLRGSLRDEARAAMLDEAEGGSADGSVGVRMAQVIEVIRQMSGGDGVQGVRGTGDGHVRRFQLAGCVFMSCINPPPLLPQDLSRILRVDMLKAAIENEAPARRIIEDIKELSPALRARALAGWQRWRRNFHLLKKAIVDTDASSRQADLLAALLAAGEMMASDDPLDAEGAGHLAESIIPVLDAIKADDTDQSDPWRCWLTLTSHQVPSWRGGDMHTVGSLLQMARHPEGLSGKDARRFLSRIGLKLCLEGMPKGETTPEAPCLYIANQHEFLRAVFEKTPWRDGGWVTSLARLEGALKSAQSLKIGAASQRAVALPLKYLPTDDDDEVSS
jgi:hypothetical protein